MLKSIAHITLYVRNQDEALAWYTRKLGLEKRDDMAFGEMRWLTLAVAGDNLEIVLHLPKEPGTEALVGKSPTLVFATSDCLADAERMRAAGVKITGEPEDQPWGVQATAEDLYGNTLVFVQSSQTG